MRMWPRPCAVQVTDLTLDTPAASVRREPASLRQLARPAAAARGTSPAAPGERTADLGRDVARSLGHVRPAVPEGDLPRRGVRVVPSDIGPAKALRMRGLPVKLHYQLVGLVVDVLVLAAASPPDGALPSPRRQLVRALDLVDVAILEQGVHTISSEAQHLGQFAAPPHPAAHEHGCADLVRCGTTAAAGTQCPAESRIQAAGRGEVEHRLLDPVLGGSSAGWRAAPTRRE